LRLSATSSPPYQGSRVIAMIIPRDLARVCTLSLSLSLSFSRERVDLYGNVVKYQRAAQASTAGSARQKELILTFRFILPVHPSALSDACCAFRENNVNRGAINQIRALASSSARTSDDAKKPEERQREREREREKERDLVRLSASPSWRKIKPLSAKDTRRTCAEFRSGILRRKSRARTAAATAAFRGGRSNSSQIEAIPRKPETNFKRIASRSRPRSVVAPRVAVPPPRIAHKERRKSRARP